MSKVIPVGTDKNGDLYHPADLAAYASEEIEKSESNMITRRESNLVKSLGRSHEKVSKALAGMECNIEKFAKCADGLESATKKASGNLKASSEKLKQGLNKILATADFDSLERYVLLLERADKAISSLAELEKLGKLAAISKALS